MADIPQSLSYNILFEQTIDLNLIAEKNATLIMVSAYPEKKVVAYPEKKVVAHLVMILFFHS